MRIRLASPASCVLGLTLLTVFSGCHSMNGYMMNSSGQAFYEKGNYAMAAAEFEKAVASEPANADYIANLARTRFKMGDVAGAEQLYRRNLMTSPSHQPSYHGLGELMMAQGRGQEATAMMTSWAATQPYLAESHLELAWLQKQTGQHDAAAQSLQQAMQVNPTHPKVLAHLGEHYQQTGQPAQAVAMYQQSLQSQWDQPEVHSRLASAAAAAGPSHPINQPMMAQAGQPGPFGPRMSAMPHPMMTSAVPASTPMMAHRNGPAPIMAHPFPPTATAQAGRGNSPFFGAPPAHGMTAHRPQLPHIAAPGMPPFALNPGGIQPTSAVQTAAQPAPSPTPDPGFHQAAVPAPLPLPATTISHTSPVATTTIPPTAAPVASATAPQNSIPTVQAF